MAEKIVNLLAADTKQQEKTEENLAGLNGKMEEILLSRQQADIDRLNEENASLRQDREQRKTFSNRIFAFMCMYMSVAIIIVFGCGRGSICKRNVSTYYMIHLPTNTISI